MEKGKKTPGNYFWRIANGNQHVSPQIYKGLPSDFVLFSSLSLVILFHTCSLHPN